VTLDNIGVVVGANSNIIRRVVVPGDHDSEIAAHPMIAGEMMLTIPKTNFDGTANALHNAVQNHRGVPPPSSRCALIVSPTGVTGNVVNIIHADPQVDFIAGHVLMLHETAQVGMTWSAVAGINVASVAV